MSRSSVLAALLLVGCGGTTTTGTSRQFDDASISSGGSPGAGGSDAGSTNTKDAGTFACGPTRCSTDEICVYRFICGCAALTTPGTDGGACPFGLEPFGDYGICFKPVECPDSYCQTWQDAIAADQWCYGRQGSLSGSIKEPIPPGSSHVCLNICIPP